MARVLVLDDHVVFGDGTKLVLEGLGHAAEVCVWLEDLPDLAALHRDTRFDVALLDLVFVRQQFDVLDALEILGDWRPPPAVVILTAGGESRRHFIEDALNWPSVRGGLPKSASSGDLDRCLTAVLAGGEYYDHEISAHRPAWARVPSENLLGRDAQIWFALARGATSHAAIAAELGCRPKTVQNRIRGMGDQLVARGLATSTQPTLRDLIHYAARHAEYFAAMERRWDREHPNRC